MFDSCLGLPNIGFLTNLLLQQRNLDRTHCVKRDNVVGWLTSIFDPRVYKYTPLSRSERHL